MLFLLQNLAAWAAAALALGVVVGVASCAGAPGGLGRIWGVLAVLIFCCAVAAYLDLAPAEYGFWLESGLIVGAAYAMGGLSGSALRRLFRKSEAAKSSDLADAVGAVIEQARALDAAAPAAINALERVGAVFDLEPAGAAPSGTAADIEPLVSGDDAKRPAPPRSGELRLIHGLDRQSGQNLKTLGVGSLAELAGLSLSRREEIAMSLGLDEAVVGYWASQARLLVHGVPAGLSRDREDDDAAPLDGATAQALSASLPQVAAPRANDALYPGARPLGLLTAPDDKDDLGRIAGMDRASAKRLNGVGIWTFRQIAAWTPDHCRWIDSYLGAPGRIARERWVEQAAALDADAPVSA